VRGDAAGIARETGVLTSEKRLHAFLARLTSQAASRQLLDAHGVLALQGRLRVTDGGAAPRELARPPLPPVAEAAEGAGPLPLAPDGQVVVDEGDALPPATARMICKEHQLWKRQRT